MRRPSPRSVLSLAAAAAAGTGVVLIIIGTFLPWFRSGSALRDSYQAIGLIRFYRLLDGSPLDLLLTLWVALAPAMTLCVVAYALGLRRTAAGLSGVLSLLTGTVATIAIVQVSSGGALLGVAGTGPVVTLTGSVLVLAGAIGVITTRSGRIGTSGRHDRRGADRRGAATTTTGGAP